METVQESGETGTRRARVRLFAGQLSWRMILVRMVVNGLTLLAVAILVPNVYFVDKTIVTLLLMSLGLGLLNAFVKPVIQLVTLPFIFATYGFAIVVINTVVLLLLDLVFEERFYVGSLAAAILGGLVMGIFASLLESLLGLNLPIGTKVQGMDNLPANGSLSITSVLIEDMAGDEPGQQVPDNSVAEPGPAADDDEPPATAMADSGPDVASAADEQVPAMTGEQDTAELSDNTDDELSGDER